MNCVISVKLNHNGQPECIQSCITPNLIGGFLPAGVTPDGCYHGDNARESKFVDYSVKKELHSKVDEMSQMMCEMTKLQDTLETYKKLTKEYEAKISSYEETMKQLHHRIVTLTKALEKNDIEVPRSESSDDVVLQSSATFPKVPYMRSSHSESSVMCSDTSPKVVRSSFTEVSFGSVRSSIKLTESLYSTPAPDGPGRTTSSDESKPEENVTLEKEEKNVYDNKKLKIDMAPCTKHARPNKLDLVGGILCQNKETNRNDKRKSLDLPSHATDESPSTNSPSDEQDDVFHKEGYPKHCSYNHHCEFGSTGSDGYLKDVTLLPCDENGYLIIKLPTSNASYRRKNLERDAETNANSNDKSDPNDEVDEDESDMCSCCKCMKGDNDVHVSWRDFHQCRNSPGSVSRSVGISMETRSRYGTLRTQATVPDPADESTHMSREQLRESIGSQTKNDSKVEDDYSEIGDVDGAVIRTSRRSSTDRAPIPLPRTSSEFSDNVFGDLSLEQRTGSPDQEERGGDKHNTLTSSMKTTQEWNLAKRKLLEKSTKRTSQDADYILGSVLEKTRKCFEDQKTKRMSKAFPDKFVIKTVKDALESTYDEDVLTTEFLDKCLQLCRLLL